ncbi:hypothetical protein GUJ93_ZPchr0003g17909 [Zizania palustris]|uniref:Uncharacterized protein n=1 Tax=Zizania palustris TaxID=103762 RepID=A0A8J5RMA5_ZIZPA|nr:hypothetical protein GUJ93_ZPchr0003g17909 [Zizania palustris]
MTVESWMARRWRRLALGKMAVISWMAQRWKMLGEMAVLGLAGSGLGVLLGVLLQVERGTGLRALGLCSLNALSTVGHRGGAALMTGGQKGVGAQGRPRKAGAEGLEVGDGSARELEASGEGARCRWRGCARMKMEQWWSDAHGRWVEGCWGSGPAA